MQDPKSGKRMPKLWNKKPIAVLQAEAADVAMQELMTHGGVPLKRTLSAMSLMALGIGNIIGAGIFALTGQAAAAHAGPAIGLSFVVSAIACAFAGMCYAEMGRAFRFREAPIPTPMPQWEKSSPGSSVGTCSSNTRWGQPPLQSAGPVMS